MENLNELGQAELGLLPEIVNVCFVTISTVNHL